jgi:restriction system protein
MAKDDQLPKFYELMNPLLQALRDLGGSGSIEELAAEVTESSTCPMPF